YFFFFSSRRRHTRWPRDWSSDVCSSDLEHDQRAGGGLGERSCQLQALSLAAAQRVQGLAQLEIPRAHADQRIERTAHVGKACERSEEHTSELQSRGHLVCRLLLEKKKQK